MQIPSDLQTSLRHWEAGKQEVEVKAQTENMRIRATWSAMHWKWAIKVVLGYSSTFSQTDKRDCGRKQRYKCG